VSDGPRGQRRSWDEGALEYAALSRVRLEALLQELLGRVGEIMDTQERLRNLLDAVVGIGADLDLTGTLDRIVAAACDLARARYGALGAVGHNGKKLVRFHTHGVTEDEVRAIGPYPEGHGILGLLIDHPEPLRLKDLTEHPQSFGFPPNHPPMRSFLGVPIRTGEHVFGNLYLTEKTGGADFTVDDEKTTIALAAAAGVVIDNARLYEDTERRRRWHEATAEITQLMLSEFDPHDALQLIARRAREVSGSEVGAVLLARGDELIVEAVDGPASFRGHLGRRLPRDTPIFGDLLASGQQVVIEDITELVEDRGYSSWLPGIEQLGRAIVAPFPAGTTSAGGLLLVAAERGRRDSASAGADLVRIFAHQVTLALDRAQALSDRSTIAVLEDRDRIARDLHDLVIQRLFATGLQLQGAPRLGSPEVQQRITKAVDDIDASIRDLRAAVFELHHLPGRSSLRTDVQALVSEYTEPLGFRPRFECSGPIDTVVPEIARPQILAAIRESLSNVVRHAAASEVLLEVAVREDEVITRVSDNGIGVTNPDRRSGLRNLRERAEALGGSAQLSDNQPHGTIVEFRFPLNSHGQL
jgi:signal transduction histidine kinase